MTVYAPSDFQSINLPDGCGQTHLRQSESEFSVTCAACEPVILALKGWGWAGTPDKVALTADEREELEIAEKQGEAAIRIYTKEMAEQFAQGVRNKSAEAKAPSLLEQLASASPEEVAALRKVLGVGEVPPPPKASGDEADSAPKRKPGRPRKTPAVEPAEVTEEEVPVVEAKDREA